MIKKLWVKFDGTDLVCFCENTNKECVNENCKEYVVKFTLIERDEEINTESMEKDLYNKRRKLTNELTKATSHMKKLTKRLK